MYLGSAGSVKNGTESRNEPLTAPIFNFVFGAYLGRGRQHYIVDPDNWAKVVRWVDNEAPNATKRS